MNVLRKHQYATLSSILKTGLSLKHPCTVVRKQTELLSLQLVMQYLRVETLFLWEVNLKSNWKGTWGGGIDSSLLNDRTPY